MSYLILHKVRGEPAFDIAEKACVDNPPCQPNCGCWNEVEGRCLMANEWVIPTSGHRAYPYKWWSLSELPVSYISDPLIPADWPDHYAVNNRLAPDLLTPTTRRHIASADDLDF